MKSQILYIYGGGGHGRVVADLARMAGYRNICFLDDTGSRKFDERLPKGDIIVAVGDNAVRERLCRLRRERVTRVTGDAKGRIASRLRKISPHMPGNVGPRAFRC